MTGVRASAVASSRESVRGGCSSLLKKSTMTVLMGTLGQSARCVLNRTSTSSDSTPCAMSAALYGAHSGETSTCIQMVRM
eukprot:CAMPEP_0119386950 /NCGR_PEP_ID=MMETSP1334-20130426/98421_1 /TAXON_ID=127549 /ORGANISM="Calcidiscus leptoporus, Strain RCC1130" /LENGTH=79 /DNA_ID=CAMNT_0007408565 /DNA_START=323 /DNA_END=559 /DNA_ORIENTATION=+